MEYITFTADGAIIGVTLGIVLYLAVACGLIFLICCVCGCYKKKAEARAIELQERIEREREMSLKKQEELEQQVENMASQVVVVHSQMKGAHSVMFCTV